MRRLLPLFILFIVMASCQENARKSSPAIKEIPSNNGNILRNKEREKQFNESSTMDVNHDVSSSSLKVDTMEDDEYMDVTYRKFDPVEVLEYLNMPHLSDFKMGADIDSIILPDNFTLLPLHQITQDSQLSTKVITYKEVDYLKLFIKKNRLQSIRIINADAVPEGMIGPGASYGDLQTAYTQPVVYGNATGAPATFKIDDITFGLDLIYEVDEPIDTEDDTEILWVQF